MCCDGVHGSLCRGLLGDQAVRSPVLLQRRALLGYVAQDQAYQHRDHPEGDLGPRGHRRRRCYRMVAARQAAAVITTTCYLAAAGCTSSGAIINVSVASTVGMILYEYCILPLAHRADPQRVKLPCNEFSSQESPCWMKPCYCALPRSEYCPFSLPIYR